MWCGAAQDDNSCRISRCHTRPSAAPFDRAPLGCAWDKQDKLQRRKTLRGAMESRKEKAAQAGLRQRAVLLAQK